MARADVRVLPDAGNWKVTLNGVRQAAYPNKPPAIDHGVRVAKANQPSSLRIHRADGTIEDERTYGDDPFPPRG
jgi:hypothetical protein